MNRYQFKDYLMSGLGRAYLELKTGDKDRFRDIVQWATLSNMTINNQSDGTPDEYVYRMIRCYDDPETFLSALITAYADFPFDDDEDKFYYFTRLLGWFVEGGFEAAEATLWRKYEEFCTLLGDPDFRPKYRVNAEDTAFCVICESLYHRVSKEKRKKIIDDIGTICVTLNEISRENFGWFLYDLYSSGLEKELLNFIKARTPGNDAFARNYGEFLLAYDYGEDSLLKNSILLDRIRAVDPYFDKEDKEDEDATREDEAEDEAEDAEESDEAAEEEESDEEENPYLWNEHLEQTYRSMQSKTNAAFYALLGEGDALLQASRFDDLVYCLQHFDEAVRDKAQELFICCTHSRAMKYARRHIAAGNKEWWTVTLLLRNYREEDKEMLLYTLYNMPRDFESDGEWHPVANEIIGMYCDFGIELPSEFFWFVYERSICRHCRFRALEKLYSRRALTAEVENECYYDASDLIRDFAREHRFRKLPL